MQNQKKSIIHEVVVNIDNFKLTGTLKDQVGALLYERDTHTHKILQLRQEYNLIKKRNEGLKKIEKHFFNGESKIPKTAATKALKIEIRRLMDMITAQEEIIKKTAFTRMDEYTVRKPELIKSGNPVIFVKNWFIYRKELKKYKKFVMKNRKADVNITVKKDQSGVHVDKNSEHSYKSEYFKEHSTWLQVGEKLKRMYYLADIPAYLSPMCFLDSSHHLYLLP